MATNSDSSAVLCEEILAEAKRQSEEILKSARRDAESSLAKAAAEADKARQEQCDRGLTEAARKKEMILATIPVEAGRLRAERVETLLESVREGALKRLLSHEGFEYGETVVNLAADAIDRMAGETFLVRVSEGDRPILGDGSAQGIMDRVGRPDMTVTISYEPDLTGGGAVVEDSEGRRMWDNRLTARLERMWPDLRRHIAVKVSFIPKMGSGGGNP